MTVDRSSSIVNQNVTGSLTLYNHRSLPPAPSNPRPPKSTPPLRHDRLDVVRVVATVLCFSAAASRPRPSTAHVLVAIHTLSFN